MKIALLSDTHGYLPRFGMANIDCVVHAGDISNCQPNDIKGEVNYWKNEFLPWCNHITKYCPLMFIAGNHDFYPQIAGYNVVHQQTPSGAYYMHNSWAKHAVYDNGDFSEMKFWGTPNVTTSNWAFPMSDDIMSKIVYEKMYFDFTPDIMICHNPPYGCGDKTTPRFGSENCGYRCLTEYITKRQPKLVVCGHIHEGYGLYKIGKTQIANVSFVDVNYTPRNKVWVWDSITGQFDDVGVI